MEVREFTLPTTCRYILSMPAELHPDPVVVVALHGYGSNPETMMRLAHLSVEPSTIVASLAAPNAHYSGAGPGTGVAAYNWGIRDHHASSVKMHHEMVHHVLHDMERQFGVGARQCFLLAFSQACGLNYRFVGTYPDAVGGAIAVCGGVPKDWEDPEKYQNFETPLLHIARSEDEFFAEAVAAKFPERLRAHATNVEFHMIPGAHRYPSKAREFVIPFLKRYGQSLL